MRTETAVALSALKKIREFWESRDVPHTCTEVHACAPTHPCMLHSAVLILVTAEGLTTRDSTGSNQRKPDFFFQPTKEQITSCIKFCIPGGVVGRNLCFKKRDVDYHKPA